VSTHYDPALALSRRGLGTASCKPVPNAIVEIWYASPAGTYSRAAEAIDTGSDYVGSEALEALYRQPRPRATHGGA
jgi:protocatechuate 3,4-dioxygenase beta subunit